MTLGLGRKMPSARMPGESMHQYQQGRQMLVYGGAASHCRLLDGKLVRT